MLAVFLPFGADAQNPTSEEVTEAIRNLFEDTQIETIETWRCYSYSDHSKEKVVVELERLGFDGKEGQREGLGIVTALGISYRAFYALKGLKNEWFFGDKDENYLIVVKADGSGLYYDFTGAEKGENRTPEEVFQCDLVK